MFKSKAIVFHFLIMFLSLPLFAQGTISVKPENTTPGKNTLYSLDFVLPDSLPPDGALSIVFPDGFNLSGVKISASNVIKGGFTTRVKGREIIIVRNGLGKTIAAGKRVDLKLAVVKNAPVASGQFSLDLYLHKQNGNTLLSQIQKNGYSLNAKLKKLQGTFTLAANQQE